MSKQAQTKNIDGEEWIELQGDLKGLFFYLGTTAGNEKISIGVGNGVHYTLHFGNKSKVLDIHKTYDGTDVHETLFRITHYSLARIAITIRRFIQSELLNWKFDIINLGKLNRHDCLFFASKAPEGSTDDLIRVLKNGRRLRLKGQFKSSILNDVLLSASEISNKSKESYYLVYSFKRGKKMSFQGVACRNPLHLSSNYFIWISKKKINQVVQRLTATLANSLENLEFENKEVLVLEFREAVERRFGKGSGMKF